MTRWYKHGVTVTVPPHGQFPIDMLRYDECWPASGEDAAQVTRSLVRHVGDNVGAVSIRVVKRDLYKDPLIAWTGDRWRSFGLSITPEASAVWT